MSIFRAAAIAVLAGLSSTTAPARADTAAPSAAPAAATSLQLFPDSRMLTRDRFSVEIVGNGPDVVLIPGLASSRAVWLRTAQALRGRYRLHIVQVAGFAGEPPRANATGPVFDPVVADLDTYLATLKRPVVIGHSLGGTMGLALAERHPEHLSKLLIVDSLPFYGVLMGGPAATPETLRPMVEPMRAHPMAMPDAQTRAMMAAMVTAPADVDRVVGWSQASTPAVTANAMVDDMLTDLRPGLAAVRVPVTVLYEPPLAAAMTTGYAPLPGVRLIAVPDAKHFIMYDQPARFDAEVEAFLKR